jgi:hypothetical protein
MTSAQQAGGRRLARIGNDRADSTTSGCAKIATASQSQKPAMAGIKAWAPNPQGGHVDSDQHLTRGFPISEETHRSSIFIELPAA